MADSELVPRPSRRARRRDEAVRRLTRRIIRDSPALADPSATLGLRRLAQLSLLAEKLYERCKSAEAGDDPQAFIMATEAFRRACQTASLLEKNLRAATAVVEPPRDVTIEMAQRIRERREQAGTTISFTPADGDG
jgi:hypothetical protein